MSLALGDRAPDFSLPAVDGSTVSLSGLNADAVVVAFSCNHCPYVMAWEDRMNAIAHDYAPRNVAMVAINANNEQTHPADSFEKMVERAAEKGFTFAYLRDADQSVARAYGAERTPEFFLLDSHGALVYRGALDDDADPDRAVQPYLREALDAVLTGGSPPQAETLAVGCSIKWL